MNVSRRRENRGNNRGGKAALQTKRRENKEWWGWIDTQSRREYAEMNGRYSKREKTYKEFT